jgi:hypothetical protein
MGGSCLGCKAEGYIEVGVTAVQLDRLVTEDLRRRGDPPAVANFAEVSEALEESVKLQSHYATLLNGHDGGRRRGFRDVEEWIQRLRDCRSSANGGRA